MTMWDRWAKERWWSEVGRVFGGGRLAQLEVGDLGLPGQTLLRMLKLGRVGFFATSLFELAVVSKEKGRFVTQE